MIQNALNDPVPQFREKLLKPKVYGRRGLMAALIGKT
jgi:hypothetical protein